MKLLTCMILFFAIQNVSAVDFESFFGTFYFSATNLDNTTVRFEFALKPN